MVSPSLRRHGVVSRQDLTLSSLRWNLQKLGDSKLLLGGSGGLSRFITAVIHIAALVLPNIDLLHSNQLVNSQLLGSFGHEKNHIRQAHHDVFILNTTIGIIPVAVITIIVIITIIGYSPPEP